MQISEAEWKILSALWQRHPATARDVVERLPSDTDWAYTTVKTMLARLVEKGAVTAAPGGPAVLYSPAISKEDARRTAVRSLLDRAFDGAFAPLVQFLFRDQKLSEADREELRRMIAAEWKQEGKQQ